MGGAKITHSDAEEYRVCVLLARRACPPFPIHKGYFVAPNQREESDWGIEIVGCGALSWHHDHLHEWNPILNCNKNGIPSDPAPLCTFEMCVSHGCLVGWVCWHKFPPSKGMVDGTVWTDVGCSLAHQPVGTSFPAGYLHQEEEDRDGLHHPSGDLHSCGLSGGEEAELLDHTGESVHRPIPQNLYALHRIQAQTSPHAFVPFEDEIPIPQQQVSRSGNSTPLSVVEKCGPGSVEAEDKGTTGAAQAGTEGTCPLVPLRLPALRSRSLCSNFSGKALAILSMWFESHLQYPFPTKQEKKLLVRGPRFLARHLLFSPSLSRFSTHCFRGFISVIPFHDTLSPLL